MSATGLTVDANRVTHIGLPDRFDLTVHTFAQASDAQLREGARVVLKTVDRDLLRPKFRKMLKSDRPKIEDVGSFVWAVLCKWKSGGLRTAMVKGVGL